MQSGKNFCPENRGDLLKNFEQESDMIRIALLEIAHWQKCGEWTEGLGAQGLSERLGGGCKGSSVSGEGPGWKESCLAAPTPSPGRKNGFVPSLSLGGQPGWLHWLGKGERLREHRGGNQRGSNPGPSGRSRVSLGWEQIPRSELGLEWRRTAWSTEGGALRLHWELLPSTESLYSQVRGTRRKGCVETAPFPLGSRAPSPHFCGNPVALLSSSLLPSTSRGAREGANYLAINTSQEELWGPQT